MSSIVLVSVLLVYVDRLYIVSFGEVGLSISLVTMRVGGRWRTVPELVRSVVFWTAADVWPWCDDGLFSFANVTECGVVTVCTEVDFDPFSMSTGLGSDCCLSDVSRAESSDVGGCDAAVAVGGAVVTC